MKFGKVINPETIDFSFPRDHKGTSLVIGKNPKNTKLNLHVGCAKWNKQDLKGFYPKGIKDELNYYSSQFNAIELNATFYRMFTKEQYKKWYDKTSDDFKFFPKITQEISHLRRLNEQVYPIVEQYLENILPLKHKLGTIFLQMHTNFGPNNWDRVVRFVENWPKEFALAIELRHTDWFNDPTLAKELYHLLEENNIANIIVDTAGRRDIMHMRLTNDEAFIRYVGANHPSDYKRLDSWVDKLVDWQEKGLRNIHFFVHQNMELESPLLSAHFISKLNIKMGTNLRVPKLAKDYSLKLF